LSDLQEGALGTNPLVADTDGDGFDDGVEVAAGTDPTDPDAFPAGGEPVPTADLPGWLLLVGALIAAGLAPALRRSRGIT